MCILTPIKKSKTEARITSCRATSIKKFRPDQLKLRSSNGKKKSIKKLFFICFFFKIEFKRIGVDVANMGE